MLMCEPHWARVPRALQSDVTLSWRRYCHLRGRPAGAAADGLYALGRDAALGPIPPQERAAPRRPDPYKHMSIPEALIWDAWLRQHPTGYDAFSYDERVGAPHQMLPDLPSYIVTMLEKVSTHRIDVVGMQGAHATLFEVKVHAGPAALGALHLYSWLWAAAHPELPAPALVIVAALAHPEVQAYCAAHGVTLYLLPNAYKPKCPR